MQALFEAGSIVRLVFVIFAFFLSLNSASARTPASTRNKTIDVPHSRFRELIPQPAVDSDSWTLFSCRGAKALKSINSSFRAGCPALSIDIIKTGPQDWNIQLLQSIPSSIPKGEVLRVHFWGRSKTTNSVSLYYGQKQNPYTRFLSTNLILTPTWQEFSVVFKPPRAVPKDWARLMFFCNSKVGNLELANISLEDWGLKPKPMPPEKNVYGTVFVEPAPPPKFFQAAQERIESIRKGGLTVRVIDRTGAPVSSACVHVQQLRHKFHFGTWISHEPLFDKGVDGKKYRDTVLKLFNSVVPMNVLKWEAEDYCDLATADRMLSWCETNNLPARGHNLLWPAFRYLPRSEQKLRGEQLKQAIKKHIIETSTRCRGRVYVWDVINEAINNTEVEDDLGKGVFVDAFKWARQGDPTAKLAYSEFVVLNNNGGANDYHRSAAVKLMDYLIKNGAPMDIYADEGHMTVPLTHGDKLIKILDEMAHFGLPIEITEYDLPITNDKIHATYLKEFLTTVFSHPAVEGFFIFEFWEGTQWTNDEGRCLFYNKDWTPRTALAVYKDLVFRNWWTNAHSMTKSDGLAKFRVFLGEHEVTVSQGKVVVSTKVRVENNRNANKTITIVLPLGH